MIQQRIYLIHVVNAQMKCASEYNHKSAGTSIEYKHMERDIVNNTNWKEKPQTIDYNKYNTSAFYFDVIGNFSFLFSQC